jgi:hypothetical protein
MAAMTDGTLFFWKGLRMNVPLPIPPIVLPNGFPTSIALPCNVAVTGKILCTKSPGGEYASVNVNLDLLAGVPISDPATIATLIMLGVIQL